MKKSKLNYKKLYYDLKAEYDSLKNDHDELCTQIELLIHGLDMQIQNFNN